MDKSLAPDPNAARPSRPELIGRVVGISGSQASVELGARAGGDDQPTVGKFMGLKTSKAVIIGLITHVAEETLAAGTGSPTYRKVARLDLIGEIRSNDKAALFFQRGFSEYPNIGDATIMLTESMLRVVYGTADANRAHIGELQQNPNIHVHIDIDHLVSRHFAVLGATGVGKSSGVAVILRKILDTRPNLRIFLIDPHNEYGNCFGDKAEVLTPRNLRLPFWLFNFEEIVDVLFGERSGVLEEVEILSEVIPLAKAAYLQYRAGGDRAITRKRDARDAGFTADTPVPYRIEDLVGLLDERMGKLENRSSRMLYHKLISRIQTFRNNPRYGFMFENANIGGDTMAEILSQLFRLPPQGKPMTVMGLAGFPAEVVELGGVGALPHGVRLRPVERRRGAVVVRLRGSAPLRRRRPQYRLRPDPARDLPHRQGRPQIRRLSRVGLAAAGRDRLHHPFAMLDVICDAAVERSRSGADPLGGVGSRRQPAVVHSFPWHPRGFHLWRRRGAADLHALPGIVGGAAAQQRGRRQCPLGCRSQHQPRHDRVRDRPLAQRQHELPNERDRRGRL